MHTPPYQQLLLYCKWNDCSKPFSEARDLYVHVCEDHIGRKQNNNLCLICGWDGCNVKTSKRDHITSHMRVHIDLKEYNCTACGKKFKRPQDLKKHEKVHLEQEYTATPDSAYYSPTGHTERHPKRERSEDPSALHPTDPLWQFLLDVKKKKIAPDYTQDMALRLEELAPALDDKDQDVKTTEQDLLELNHFLTLLQQEIGIIDANQLMEKQASPTSSPYKTFESPTVPLTSSMKVTELQQHAMNMSTDFGLTSPTTNNDAAVAYAMQLFPGLTPSDAVYAAYAVRVKQTWPPEKKDVPSHPPQSARPISGPQPSAPPLETFYAPPPPPQGTKYTVPSQSVTTVPRAIAPKAPMTAFPILPPPVPSGYIPVLMPASQGEAAMFYQQQWAMYHQQQQHMAANGYSVMLPPYSYMHTSGAGPMLKRARKRDIFRRRSKSVDATPNKDGKSPFGIPGFIRKLFPKRDASPPRERKPRPLEEEEEEEFIEMDPPSRELTESPIHEELEPMDISMPYKSPAADTLVTRQHVMKRRVHSDTNLPRLCVTLRKMKNQMMIKDETITDGWVNVDRLLEPMNKLSIHTPTVKPPIRSKTTFSALKPVSRQMSIDEPETRLHHMTLISNMLSRINRMIKSVQHPPIHPEEEEWQLVSADNIE